jgi:Mitochondrial carrier protein
MASGRKERKPVNWTNVAVGSALQLFEVTTLGQPFEVIKTQVAANRTQTLPTACRNIYARGGMRGFWQGLYPWAWIEAVTKGGILLLAQSEIEAVAVNTLGTSSTLASALGGIGGGVAQAYTTMGFCTFMKTVEVTRVKGPDGTAAESSISVARGILRTEGIRGVYKGVSAVALRQASNWGSRFGISRVVESLIRGRDESRVLTTSEALLASVAGGGLAVWNHPFEVCRIEMQSMVKADDRPAKMTIGSTARYVYNKDGIKGLYRGVVPRIALSVYLTVVMVFGGDRVKQAIKESREQEYR